MLRGGLSDLTAASSTAASRRRCGARVRILRRAIPQNQYFAEPLGSYDSGGRRNQSGAQRDGQDQPSENKTPVGRGAGNVYRRTGRPCRLMRRFRNQHANSKFRHDPAADLGASPPRRTSTAEPTRRPPPPPSASTDALGNENTFLQLLVAQIQNQDPTSPMDSSTFLTQLAEFSSRRAIDRYSAGCPGIGSDATTSTTPSTSSTSGS